jgi:FKBP-type peptidyl-prolyl cis-trans isomerase (trigger factor)
MKWEMASLEEGYRELRIETPWDEIAPDYEDILQDFRWQRVPGFRPGKAPRQLMEQRFRRQISEQLSRRGADRLCRQALQESGTEAAGPVEVSDLEWEPGQPFRFTARFFPLPEFELPDYQSLGLNAEAAADPQGALSLRLLELVSFPVPQALVQAELALDGLEDCQPASESWQAASQRVRLMLILKRLARSEGIEIEPAAVDRRIEEKAAEFGTRPETLRAELEKSGGKLLLRDLLLAESVLEYLLETIRQQAK